MKLLSVITTMNPVSGGPAQGIRNNFFYWVQEGLDPHVVSLDSPMIQFEDDVEIITMGSTAKNIWYYSPNLLPWLIENLPLYDVVLVHGLWQYNGYAVYKAIKKLKKKNLKIPKVFVMTHGMLDPYFQKSKERKLKALRNSIYWHLIEKKLINSANGVLFTCEEELQLAKTTFNDYRPKAVYNIGYGIVQPPNNNNVISKTFYERFPEIEGKKYLLFISRIHPKKGLDLFIGAYKYLTNKYKDTIVKLPYVVIAGPGIETIYGNKLKHIIDTDKNLKDKFFFTGMLTGNEKWGAFYGAEAFILPSHQENFGIAVAEALACYKTVLITNKVNIWQEIVNGSAGIASNDDLTGVTEALEKWINLHPKDRELMALNAYDTYKRYFTAEATSKKFIQVLKSNI